VIGTTVQHYQVVGKLGEGGMGVVWKARDTRLDRFVALKFIPDDAAQDSSASARFVREARAASALNHPNICTIHDVGDSDGRQFIVMELIEGQTLALWVAAAPRDIESILDVGIQLSSALEAAHAQGIVHRDIKTSNVMITESGRVKILDFGLAKMMMPDVPADGSKAETAILPEQLTEAGQAVGTVNYMSPEQALGQSVDHRTDIFSLGAVLYELATGARAFPGSTVASIFDAILNRDPVDPASLNDEIPEGFVQIIHKALEKDRELRYRSAADVETDLKRLQRDTTAPISSGAAESPRSWPKWPVILAAVSVVAALGWYMGFGRPEPAIGPLTTRPLTTYVGMEWGGSWSPDGNYFVYSHTADGSQDIFVESANGGDRLRIVDSPADDKAPRWSPDNRWISYTSQKEGSWGIYLVPPLGGSVTELTRTGHKGTFKREIMGQQPWSPDGSWLVYTELDSVGTARLWRIDVETRRRVPVTDPAEGEGDLYASWSPDGSQIVFGRYSGGQVNLMVVDPEGSNLSSLTDDEDHALSPSWLPDSSGLVYVSNRLGDQALCLLRLGDDSLAPLVASEMSVYGPSVSSDGRILYGTTVATANIFIQDVSSGRERRMTSFSKGQYDGVFSPDGNHIAYSSSRTGNMEIFLLDVSSGRDRQLTTDPGFDRYPTWSPDGTEIVFMSARSNGEGGGPRLWAMPIEGGAPRCLSDKIISAPLVCSPEGDAIGFIASGDDGPAMWVYEWIDGSVRKVLEDVRKFDWYLDSDRVVVTTDEPTGMGEMRAVDLSTQESRLLLSRPFEGARVRPDGRAVSYATAVSHYGMRLQVLTLKEGEGGLPIPIGEPKTVIDGGGEWHVHNNGWSPDGRYVIYERHEHSGDLHVLEGAF
jgi:Tol biopolymer transport system component/predicted Ser/Thr protein kinase